MSEIEPFSASDMNGTFAEYEDNTKPPSIPPPSSAHTSAPPAPQKSIPLPALTNDVLQELVTDLETAASNGLTMLPSRDIPKKVMFQPRPTEPTQIRSYSNEQPDSRIQDNASIASFAETHLHSAILLVSLFFCFQLPIVKQKVSDMVATLYSSTETQAVGAYIALSILFTVVFYGLVYITSNFTLQVSETI